MSRDCCVALLRNAMCFQSKEADRDPESIQSSTITSALHTKYNGLIERSDSSCKQMLHRMCTDRHTTACSMARKRVKQNSYVCILVLAGGGGGGAGGEL